MGRVADLLRRLGGRHHVVAGGGYQPADSGTVPPAAIRRLGTREEIEELPPGDWIRLYLIGHRSAAAPDGKFLGYGPQGVTISQGMGRATYFWSEIASAVMEDDAAGE